MGRMRMSNYQKYLALVGPTCIGKTQYTDALTKRYPIELINLDSFQIYTHVSVGTGRSDLKAPRAHLYGFIEPNKLLTPKEYVAHVRTVIPSIEARSQMPVFEGGSLSYLRALVAEYPLRIVGLRPASIADIEYLIDARMAAYKETDLFQEVRNGLRMGLRDTQVMKDDVVYLPIVEFLDGKLSHDAAFARIRLNLLRRFSEQMQGYGSFEIEWLTLGDAVSTQLDTIVQEMLNA
jgi:tRNA A37 N6-isopentenylltransferase MiaA